MRLRSLLPASPDERARLAFAMGAFMCVAPAGIVARTMGTTLFLNSYGSEKLPMMFVGTAIVVTAASFGFGVLARKLPIAQLIGVTSLIFVIATVALRLALLYDYPPLRIVAYFLSDVLSKVPATLFWSFAAMIFNPREAKRLFGVIGASGTLACAIAGALVKPFTAQFGTEALLTVAGVLLAGFGGIGLFYAHHESRRIASSQSHKPTSGRAPTRVGYYKDLLGTEQVRNLALIVILSTAALSFTDFQFKFAAKARFSGPELAGFFGSFFAATNVVALVFQLTVVPWILRSGGVLVALCFLPACLLITSVGTALTGDFRWIVASKFVDPVLDFTVNTAAMQMLFLGIKKQSRSQARTLIDGFAKPAAVALTGLALAAGTKWGRIEPWYLGAIVAVASALWLVLGWRNYGGYVRGLVDSLGAKRFDISEEAVDFTDKNFEKHIRTALTEAPDEEIPYLLGVLPDLGHIDFSAEYRKLLLRKSPEVKVAALEWLAEHGDRDDRALVLGHFRHEDPDVRRAAIHAAAKLGGSSVADALKARLDDQVPTVRAAASAELVNVGDLDGLMSACIAIKEMLVSGEEAARIAAADGLAKIRHEGLARPLSILLADPHESVRLAALAACRNRPLPDLIPAVLPLLAERKIASAAADAAVAFGTQLIEHVDRLSKRQGDRGEELHAFPSIVARIGDPVGIPLVQRWIASKDKALCAAGVDAYCRLLRREPSLKPYRADLDASVLRELAEAKREAERARRLGPLPHAAVARDAIREQAEQALRNAFAMLDVVTQGVDLGALCETLMREQGERRAEALEILDNVLEKEMKGVVLPLFESIPTSVPSERDARTEIESILESPDEVTDFALAGAMFAAAEGGDVSMSDAIMRQLLHANGVVRETAEYAVRKLGGDPMTTPLSKKPAAAEPGGAPA